jgi:hypothetical protein
MYLLRKGFFVLLKNMQVCGGCVSSQSKDPFQVWLCVMFQEMVAGFGARKSSNRVGWGGGRCEVLQRRVSVDIHSIDVWPGSCFALFKTR